MQVVVTTRIYSSCESKDPYTSPYVSENYMIQEGKNQKGKTSLCRRSMWSSVRIYSKFKIWNNCPNSWIVSREATYCVPSAHNCVWFSLWRLSILNTHTKLAWFLEPVLTLLEGPSTVFCVAVAEWTVVIKPSSIPNFWWMTLAKGAKQLVVQEALLTTILSLVYCVWLTPMTNIGASADGAEMITFLAPPFRWAWIMLNRRRRKVKEGKNEQTQSDGGGGGGGGSNCDKDKNRMIQLGSKSLQCNTHTKL